VPFENFYEKSDKENRRRHKKIVYTFVLLAINVISFYGLYCISVDYIDEYFKTLRRIKNVDLLCAGLPKPEQFYFVKKENAVNLNNSTKINYLYQSNRSVDEIMPSFFVWFDSKGSGWKRVPNSNTSFTKGEQKVTIRQVDSPSSNYEITCSEEDISFGIYD
jgi:hypothetical protein